MHLVAVVVVSFLLQKSPRIFPIIITRLTLSPMSLKNAFLSLSQKRNKMPQQPLSTWELKNVERRERDKILSPIDVGPSSLSPIRVLERLGRNDLAKKMLESPYYTDSPPRRRIQNNNNLERKNARKNQTVKKRIVSPTPYSVDCITSPTTNLTEKPKPKRVSKKKVRFSKQPPERKTTVREYVPDCTYCTKICHFFRR